MDASKKSRGNPSMRRAMSARDDAVATSRHARRAAVQAAEPTCGADDMCARDGFRRGFFHVYVVAPRHQHMRAALVPSRSTFSSSRSFISSSASRCFACIADASDANFSRCGGFKKLHRGVHSSCPSAMPIVLISPAKSLNELPPPSSFPRTQPRFKAEAAELASTAKKLTAANIKSLMSVSDAIAALNVERFEAFESASTKPCALAFDGPAYRALDAGTMTPADVAFARQHLRFLSGLYGLLAPTDAVAPHRLEMGTKLVTNRGANLYEFWGDAIADAIARDLALLPEPQRFVVNCASAEYWKAAKSSVLKNKHGARVVTCVFPGPAVHAKAARGAMCRHVVTERVVDAEGLKRFTGANGEWAFARVEREKGDGPAGDERFVFARVAAKETKKTPPGKKTELGAPKRALAASKNAKRAKTKQ